MIREVLPPDTGLCFEAMRVLRTGLAGREEFIRVVDEVQRPEGYRLAGAFEEGVDEAVAVAGFRLCNYLAWGRAIYVDDLSTLPAARRRGHGRALLDWLTEEAERLGCASLQLDSGVGPERATAHRLYMNAGLRISSHHFSRALGEPGAGA